jgi:predicted DNA-binding transcriptional regulator AlpA
MINPTQKDHPNRLGRGSLIPPMVTTKELAELIGVPVATLNNWRSIGRGPRSFRLGRAVKYSLADVAAWIEQQQQADDHYQSFTPLNAPHPESPRSTLRS